MHRRHNYWSKSRESDDPFKEARKFRRRGGACSASRSEGCEKNRPYVWHAGLRVGKREGRREEAVMRLPSHNHFVLDLRGSTERAFADAIVLWGTGYSSVMNSNLVDALRSNL